MNGERIKLSLPTDSEERKTYPLFRGLFGYFGAALAAVAHHSYTSNETHNPGEELHHARGKSTDHEDCILRHTLDLGEMLSQLERGTSGLIDRRMVEIILYEANARAWRALAASQELQERFNGAPVPAYARDPVVKCDDSQPYHPVMGVDR